MNEELKNIDPSENGEAAEPTPSSVTDAAPVSPAQPAEPVPEASADEKATETPAAEQPSEAPAAEPVQPNPQQSYAHPNPQYAYTQPNYTRPVNNPAANGYSPYNQYPQTPGPGVYYGGAPTYIQPQPPKPKKQKKEKKKNPTRAVAWLTALCIVCSALFGVGGVFVGSLLFGNGSINNVTGSNNASGINYNTGEIMTPKDSDGTVVTAVQIAADSVVEITTEQVAFYFGEYISSGAGSGVIIDSDGYIITCAHVVDGADSITVKLSNGDSHEAKLIGSDT